MLHVVEPENRTTRPTKVPNALEKAAHSADQESGKKPYIIDSLASSIIHDLRNPLAAIWGCTEMLLDVNLAPAQTRRVSGNIRQAASRMRSLLSDFADITRGHAEAAEACNLYSMIEAAREAACAVRQDGIEVLLDVPAHIEIAAAPSRMERVFVNLIVNALEAMPDGGTVRITAGETGGDVRIDVEDTGPGIPAEIRGRVFEPFVTAGKDEGLGLGLALSRQTVREHGGELWAEPAPGAHFVISMPLGWGPQAA